MKKRKTNKERQKQTNCLMPERDRKKEKTEQRTKEAQARRKEERHEHRNNFKKIVKNLKSKVLSLKYTHSTGFTSKYNQESAGTYTENSWLREPCFRYI